MMDPQKKFLLAAADMEQALADALHAVIEHDDFCPEQLEWMLKLITKKEIILSFLLDDINKLNFKPQKRKKTFRNTNPIWIPAEGFTGPANPYPSTIQVSGVKGVIKKITVTLRHIYHTWPRDIHAMLVGPEGQNIILFSTVGGGTTFENLTLTFDDDASSQIPAFGPVNSGKYQPTARTRVMFPPPAPVPSPSTHLSIYKGTNPNGIWQLFVQDVFTNDTGVIAGGWEITITTEDPKTKKTYTNTFIQDDSMDNQIEENSEQNELISDTSLILLDQVKEEWKYEDTIKPQKPLRKDPRMKYGQEDDSQNSHDYDYDE